MEHFPVNFEQQSDDSGLQPEMISAELPLDEQLQGYTELLEKAEREPADGVYQRKLIDHYRKMIELIRGQIGI